ncbi:MAG: PAS domain S-box protein [Methanolinea sp.]|nr:PAS domain S-box protein [Methanolinea sp.]
MRNASSSENIEKIKKLLSENPQGLCINEVARLLKRHRNSVSRDLHALLVTGQVEAHSFGTTRVFTLAAKKESISPLDCIRDMVIVIDGRGTVIDANASLLAFLGCRKDDLIGHQVSDFPLLSLPLEHSSMGASPGECQMIFLSPKKGGSHFSLKMRRFPAIVDNGELGEFIIIQDCTEVQCLQDALDSEKQIREAFSHVSSLFYIHFLPRGETLSCSDWYASRFFPSAPPPTETNFFSLLDPEDAKKLQSVLASLSPEKPSITLTLLTGTPGNALYPIEWKFHAIFDRDLHVQSILATGVDLSLQMRAQEQVRQKERFVAILTRALGNFLDERNGDRIYTLITHDIGELIPGASVAAYSLDQESQSCILEAVSAPEHRSGPFPMPNPVWVGRKFSLKNDRTDFLLSPELTTGDMTWTVLTPSWFLAESLQNENIPPGEHLPEDPPCCAGISWGGTLHGIVEIYAPREEILEQKSFLVEYLKLCALALRERQSLRKKEFSMELFETVAAISSQPIAIIDRNGRYTYVSPHFTDLFGYTQEDIPNGRAWFMRAFPDLSLQKRARELWKRDLASSSPGEIRPRQFTVRCKDGVFKDISFLPITLSNGDQLVVYEDLTPRHESVQMQNLLFHLFVSSHDGIYITSTDGRVISWNPAAQRIYGYSFEEIQGQSLKILEPPHLVGEIHGIQKKALEGGYLVDFETQRVRKDGRIIDVSLTVSSIKGAGGQIVGIFTIVRDITLKKSEERLRNAEYRYQDLVSSINIGVYRSTGDPEGRFVWRNKSLLEMLGFESLDQLNGTGVSSLFAKEGGREELLGELRRNGFVKNREVLLRRRDGSVLRVLVTALATFQPDGSIAFINGIVEDITYLRSLEEKIDSIEKKGKNY